MLNYNLDVQQITLIIVLRPKFGSLSVLDTLQWHFCLHTAAPAGQKKEKDVVGQQEMSSLIPNRLVTDHLVKVAEL